MRNFVRILESVLTPRQIVTLLAVGIIVLFAGCTTSVTTPAGHVSTSPTLTKVSVALDYFPWCGQVGLWVAQEKGYFADEKLDVKLNVPSDPSTVLQTVASGRDDFGLNYQTNVLLARDQDIPVVSVIGIVQHPLNSIMTLKDSGITEPKHLVGKKIGWNGIPENEKFLETILKNEGKSLDDVEMINVGFDLVPALISKKVDALIPAYWVFESIMAENQGFPVNIMHLEQHGIPDYYEFLLVTTAEKIANNPDLVQRFVDAVKRGYEDAMKDPETAVQLMKQANPEVDLSVDVPCAKLLVPLWKADKRIFGWQEESKWTEFAQWMKDNGLLSKDFDATKSFDNQFIANTGK